MENQERLVEKLFMENIIIDINAARKIALASQGLLVDPTTAAQKSDIAAAIRRIHALQIDTINVVARAPYHILWSRLGSFSPAWLDELHAEGHLFEYWAHAACFLPIEDYPVYRRMMLDDRVGWDNIKQWAGENEQILKDVLDYIRLNGPVKSSDFKSDQQGGGWWNWKSEKVALEYLFTRGDLMILRREKFQRIYDLRERVLPNWHDEAVPSYEEAVKSQVLKAIQALGIAREDWVAKYFYLPQKKVAEVLLGLAEAQEIYPVKVEGLNQKQAYLHKNTLPTLAQALNGSLIANKTTLLSPFDPLISDRSRTKALFDFDYTIECYLPAAKRKYGYFVLPILHNGQIIGRLDAKAWRKEKLLEIIKLYLEPNAEPSDELIAALSSTLQNFAHWQGLDSVKINWSEPAFLKESLT